MKGMLGVFVFIALTAFCWGVYGPVLQNGKVLVDGELKPSALRAFTCVGLAYFGIAVLVPGIVLALKGEVGRWSRTGTIWSVVAGAAGALGALGIIMAFKNQGNAIYVMPLVFGGAPVVNTFLTMYMNKSYKETGPLFFAGLILVVAGAVTVLLFRPVTHAAAHAAGPTPEQIAMVAAWVATTAFSWGIYGPLLHKGQSAMAGSRLRPLICVGLAYFMIAVLLPVAIMMRSPEAGQWNLPFTLWSLGGGAAGAIGALGLILAFNAGGKPIYVMPLVFGGAPVINTFATILSTHASVAGASPWFFAGLIIVALGAVTVLIFAPRGKPHAAPAKASPKHGAEPVKT